MLDRFLFSSRFSGLLFGGKRDRGKFSTGAAPRRREISSPCAARIMHWDRA